MSTSNQGAIRPNHTPFDLHQLNKALITCDAISALIEGAVSYPGSLTAERLVILSNCLREAADTLDPRVVRQARSAV